MIDYGKFNDEYLLEIWAEKYIQLYDKFPPVDIRFRNKLQLLNKIKELDVNLKIKESDNA
jgi:hypothetical protein